jgi:putative transposase
MKVREAGRVVNVACLVATGVNADGHREILGLDVCSAESHAGWLTFFRGLTARGLAGVSLVTSDAHPGLVAAVAATLPGAAWQRSFVSMEGGGMVPLVHLCHRERTLAT